jgi:hypothetical protein
MESSGFVPAEAVVLEVAQVASPGGSHLGVWPIPSKFSRPGRFHRKESVMTEIVYAIPILHGKEDFYRQTADELADARRDEYEAALKDAGVTRQAVWHQQTPVGGNLAIVYNEATDPDALRRFVSSDADISRWFVERMQEAYGRDVSQPPLPVELILDFRL